MSFRQGKAIVATGAGACALVAVTAGCPHSAPAGAAPDNSIVPGQAVFARTCAVCHQPTGSGVTGVFPPLAGSELVDGDVRRLMRIVLNGLQGPIRLKAGAFNNVMSPQGLSLSDAEIAAVLTFVRSSWGHHASAVTKDDVARERMLGRTAPWTWSELGP